MVTDFFSSRPRTASPLDRLDPRIKLACALSLIIAVTSCASITVLLPPALLTLLLLSSSRMPLKSLLGLLLTILPLMGAMATLFFLSYLLEGLPPRPSLFFAHPLGLSFRLILFKSLLALLLLRLLILTTSLADLLRAMRFFKVPRIITTLSNLVYTYLHILTAETERILRARSSRSVGSSRRSLRTLAHIGASVFLRSFARADQVYKAMLARGFCGEYPTHQKFRAGWPESLSIATVTAVLTAMGYLCHR